MVLVEKYLREGLNEFGHTADDEQIRQFMRYMEHLAEVNQVMNLTAITEPFEVVTKHFLDSASILEYACGEVIDIGTGAGFPGMPLKILNPSLSVTLLDSLNKRIVFLTGLAEQLGLDVRCVHARAEDFCRIPPNREFYDTVTSRAVSNLSALAEYCLPFAKIGGKFISMKGSDAKDEILLAKRAIFEVGGEISEVKTVKIPFTDIEHSLIIISKLRHTPEKYPRKSVKIAKSPIM